MKKIILPEPEKFKQICQEVIQTMPKIDVAKKMAELYGLSVNNIIFLPNDCA